MATCRYGIHGMREEHFGMAPAEMVRAGMIVWVPRGGGQVEIVGADPALAYDTDEHAADSIARVVHDPAEQNRLRDWLAVCGDRFGVDRFVAEVREIVRDVSGVTRAYRPLPTDAIALNTGLPSSSLYVPVAATRPPCRKIRRSQSWTVDKRCAITMSVRVPCKAAIADVTSRSVWLSSAAVASSKTRTAGSA